MFTNRYRHPIALAILDITKAFESNTVRYRKMLGDAGTDGVCTANIVK